MTEQEYDESPFVNPETASQISFLFIRISFLNYRIQMIILSGTEMYDVLIAYTNRNTHTRARTTQHMDS